MHTVAFHMSEEFESSTAARFVTMPRSRKEKPDLLANPQVKVRIDDSMLGNAITLSLASVRMKPSVELLTRVVGLFAKEKIVPVIQAYLKKDGVALYLPGSDVPYDVHRLIEVLLEEPLANELEAYMRMPRSQLEAPEAKVVEFSIRTSPDILTPHFAPVQSHGAHSHGSLSSACPPAIEKKHHLSKRAQEVRANR
jgi:hypothetical protein